MEARYGMYFYGNGNMKKGAVVDVGSISQQMYLDSYLVLNIIKVDQLQGDKSGWGHKIF